MNNQYRRNVASSMKCNCIVSCLVQREYSSGNTYRKSLKILRTVICTGRSTFRKVWEKRSNKHISSDGSNIFFDNYRQYYSKNSLSCSPHKFYHRPSVPLNEKIEDALICRSYQGSLHPSKCDQKESLIALTANNHIHVYNLYTGELLQDHLLVSNKKFRDLAWSVDQESLVVRSTHNKITAFVRQAGLSISLLMVLAVFNVLPLRFVGMMEIDKKIWGKDVSDAMVTGGLLILMFQSGVVRMFNFVDIIKKYTKNEDRSRDMVNTVHFSDFHLNINVTEQPPVLFEVKCSEHNVQLGGFPWHYIITPYGSLGYFSVHSLNDRKVIEGGNLESENSSIEIDRAVFHGDESGRIIHIANDTIKVFSINTTDNENSKLAKSIEITVKDDDLQNETERSNKPTVTSSGRIIKKRLHQDEISDSDLTVTVYNVEYENELDVLCVSSVLQLLDTTKAFLDLYDNYSGNLLRRIPITLPFSIFELYEHSVSMDRDTVVHVVKSGSSKFVCTVYKLFGDNDDSPENSDDKKEMSSTSTSVL